MGHTIMDLRVTGFDIDTLDELEGTNKSYQDLQSFLTANGKTVVTSKAALIDDGVCILHGASMPIILRPEGDDKYSVTKEALVLEEDKSISNILFGQGTELSRRSQKTREIWLIQGRSRLGSALYF